MVYLKGIDVGSSNRKAQKISPDMYIQECT